jgi:hypothetical protein
MADPMVPISPAGTDTSVIRAAQAAVVSLRRAASNSATSETTELGIVAAANGEETVLAAQCLVRRDGVMLVAHAFRRGARGQVAGPLVCRTEQAGQQVDLNALPAPGSGACLYGSQHADDGILRCQYVDERNADLLRFAVPIAGELIRPPTAAGGSHIRTVLHLRGHDNAAQ